MNRPGLIAGLLAFALSTCSVVSAQEKARTAGQNRPGNSIFIFHTDEFWLNLHHFLYVLGRAQNKTFDSSREAVIDAPADQDRGLAALTTKERNVWNEAVAAYAIAVSKRDLIFDDQLPVLTKTLAQAGDARSLTSAGIDRGVAAVLQRVAPIYRKAWWPAHQSTNKAWRSAIQPYVDQHGPTVLNFITRTYQLSWPEAGYAVHVSAYTNWAGAYSTRGDLLVISSASKANTGLYALEIVFHEGMHQWDSQVFEALGKQARLNNKSVPENLSHAMIFFTAGEAVRRVAPEHVPYADKYGIWQRGSGRFKQPLEQTWRPYLDGKGTRDEALAELIKLTGESKP